MACRPCLGFYIYMIPFSWLWLMVESFLAQKVNPDHLVSAWNCSLFSCFLASNEGSDLSSLLLNRNLFLITIFFSTFPEVINLSALRRNPDLPLENSLLKQHSWYDSMISRTNLLCHNCTKLVKIGEIFWSLISYRENKYAVNLELAWSNLHVLWTYVYIWLH